ncbi:unnamed protein product, partial [Didymodactylos carnosus]
MPAVPNRPARKQKKQPRRFVAEDEDKGQEPLSKVGPLCDDDKKFKNRPYLEPVRIRAHLNTLAERNKNAVARHVIRYCVEAAPFLDKWVCDQYEYQVWQKFLKLGSDTDSGHIHWAQEIVKRTKTRDSRINKEFCVTQMTRLQKSILTASNEVTRSQGELAAFAPAMLPAQTSRSSSAGVAQSQPEQTVTGQVLFADEILRKYIQVQTHYVAKKCATRVAIAVAEQAEYTALQLFENRATAHQKTHAAVVKPKFEVLHIKEKNMKVLAKQVEFDMVPKSVPKFDFHYRIDEQALSPAQIDNAHRDMRKLVLDFQKEAVQLMLQTATEECDNVRIKVTELIDGMPEGEADCVEGSDEDAQVQENGSFRALFNNYLEARAIRLNKTT